MDNYPFTLRPLSTEDGGGFAIEFPDLPGCISDGETPEEAIENGRDALAAYLRSCAKHGDPTPKAAKNNRNPNPVHNTSKITRNQ
jgi:antitoxin HicB